ncbi:Rpn family recombination-promoting nuclease/putative transposase [Pedobacter gandavensis]|uniref:Rpn family recombination-promoting nuclease/putative transposase n=1 Tax=Pedobacter gandavensis TaxID=2679963 RepID=UPI00292DE5D4|nr:Rpn family recombination-promoting nuclease/putative transposase [Pedobacter gandavensis]
MELNDVRQGSAYDKIFKENMEANLEGIVEQVLSMKIVLSEEIPDDLQQTKERKPDLLKKVQDEKGQIFILHIEYQRKNDQDMAYRMAEYSIMLQKKYRLPVSQHMIYIGKERINMPISIDTTNFKFSYNAQAISTVDYKLFLSNKVLEMKLLSILGDLGTVKPREVLTTLVNIIKTLVPEELAYNKYINQLKVLTQLRDLEHTLKDVMDEVENFYVKERDPYYRVGKEEGILEGKLEGKRDGKLQIARKMIKEGIAIPLIVRFTGLTKKEVSILKSRLFPFPKPDQETANR